MQTDRDKNELYLKLGKMMIAVRRFAATAGGNVNIEFSFFNGYMKIIEDKNEE